MRDLDTQTARAVADELDSFATAFAEGHNVLASQGCVNEAAVLGGVVKALAARAAVLRGGSGA